MQSEQDQKIKRQIGYQWDNSLNFFYHELGKKDLSSLKLAFEQLLLFTAIQFFVWFGKEFQRVEAATANDCPPLVFKLNACFARRFWLQKHRSQRLIFFRKSMMSMVQCKPWGAWKVMKETGYAVQLATSEHSMKSGVTCSVLKMKKWSPQWTQFMQLHEEAWKKFRTSMGFEPITETRPFKNVNRENANKWKMTLI